MIAEQNPKLRKDYILFEEWLANHLEISFELRHTVFELVNNLIAEIPSIKMPIIYYRNSFLDADLELFWSTKTADNDFVYASAEFQKDVSCCWIFCGDALTETISIDVPAWETMIVPNKIIEKLNQFFLSK